VIHCVFRFGNQIQEIVVKGNDLFFVQEGVITSIEGIKFSREGVLKEFPDLEEKEDWRKIAIERLKTHIKKMKTEMEAIEYVKSELEKQGYEAMFFQRAGWRPQLFKEKK